PGRRISVRLRWDIRNATPFANLLISCENMTGSFAQYIRSGHHMRYSHDPHHDGSPDYVSLHERHKGHPGHARLCVRVPGGADAVYAHVVEDGEAELVEGELEHSSNGVSWFSVRIPLLAVVTSYRFTIVRGRHTPWLYQPGANSHAGHDVAACRLSS